MSTFAQVCGSQLRKISQRLPDIGTKIILHLHRPFIGNVYVPIEYESFRIMVNPQDYCGGRLYYWGSYEPRQTKSLIEVVNALRPSTFVDVGANIGYYSLLLAARGVSVISIEPSPYVFAALEESIESNCELRSRISLVRAAASDSEGDVHLWINTIPHNFGLGSAIRSQPGSESVAVIVQGVRLDNIISSKTSRPILCKIDVEGSELRVLTGMLNVIQALRPVFIIELHPIELEEVGSTAREVLEVLWRCDYLTGHLGTPEPNINVASTLPTDNFWILARPKEIEWCGA